MRLLILTKRNFDSALWFKGHVEQSINWTVDLSVDNANSSPLQSSLPEYDLIWMYYYPHIIKKETLQLNKHWLNTHPSYLPFNRGSAPNFFSIVNNTPAGVSVHKVVSEVDRGDVLARSEVKVRPHWTGEDLYYVLLDESLFLTISTFDEIKDCLNQDSNLDSDSADNWDNLGTNQTKLPYNDEPTNRLAEFHMLHDLDAVWEQTHDLQYIMRIIRASTFGRYTGAYYTDENGNKIEIKGRFRVLE